jgi:hypothetical protein
VKLFHAHVMIRSSSIRFRIVYGVDLALVVLTAEDAKFIKPIQDVHISFGFKPEDTASASCFDKYTIHPRPVTKASAKYFLPRYFTACVWTGFRAAGRLRVLRGKTFPGAPIRHHNYITGEAVFYNIIIHFIAYLIHVQYCRESWQLVMTREINCNES